MGTLEEFCGSCICGRLGSGAVFELDGCWLSGACGNDPNPLLFCVPGTSNEGAGTCPSLFWGAAPTGVGLLAGTSAHPITVAATEPVAINTFIPVVLTRRLLRFILSTLI